MLGKLVDGVLITPTEDEYKKIVIINPTEEQLKQVLGYKTLIKEEMPEIKEGDILRVVYEETETEIIERWEL